MLFKNFRLKRYSNKYFSVLGDSISTLQGYNPPGYSVFYDEGSVQMTGVSTSADTWWGKLINYLGGSLLVNDAWSGSRVSAFDASNNFFPSGCSPLRTGNLGRNGLCPDVIIVYLGTNDWANGVKPYVNEAYAACTAALQYFDFAYEYMLRGLKDNYPNAEIWCCTLPRSFMSSDPSFTFPDIYQGSNIEVYNNIIRSSAQKYGCRCIDIFSSGVRYDSVDGAHPNAIGMSTMAQMIIEQIKGAE